MAASFAGPDIVVVGASAGGVEALRALVGAFPASYGGAVFVVLHLPRAATSGLAAILDRAGPLRAAQSRGGEPIEGGRIYVAPPDRHLCVAPGAVELRDGAPEKGHRPAIDPLFRSAALAYGALVAGVVLSGVLDDGSAGLLAVVAAGGAALAQDPDEALYPMMPTAAAARVGGRVTVLTAAGIAAALAKRSTHLAESRSD